VRKIMLFCMGEMCRCDIKYGSEEVRSEDEKG